MQLLPMTQELPPLRLCPRCRITMQAERSHSLSIDYDIHAFVAIWCRHTSRSPHGRRSRRLSERRSGLGFRCGRPFAAHVFSAVFDENVPDQCVSSIPVGKSDYFGRARHWLLRASRIGALPECAGTPRKSASGRTKAEAKVSRREVVGATGIEPVTPTMSRKCSSAELRARSHLRI